MNTKMLKNISTGVLAIGLSLGLASPAFSHDENAEAASKTAKEMPKHKHKRKSKHEAKVVYACPMHPEEKSDKAGKCSKCGMDLVKMDSPKK